MKKDKVPQDNAQTYSGNRKVIYATNGEGSYEKVLSSGWDVEEAATLMAVEAINELAHEAYLKAGMKKCSPLEYHMYMKRFDLMSFSQTTGFFKWQIKRHFKLSVFNKLSQQKIAKYLEVLGITEQEFKSIPEKMPTL